MARSYASADCPLQQLPTEEAYDAMLPDIIAIPDDRTVTVNLDVVSAVNVVLAALPDLRALRPQIVDELPRFDIQRFDRLEQYALALGHAHLLYRSASTSKGIISDLGNELSALRDRLLASAQSLVCFELLDPARLKDCKRKNGYRATVAEVLALIALFKENWSEFENKTPLTMGVLDVASTRAVELLGAIGLKEQTPVSSGEAAMIRQKAFAAFLRAYEDARRVVSYLRHYAGDADFIAPSLYAGRGGRRAREYQEQSGPGAEKGTEPVGSTDTEGGSEERSVTNTFSN